jgi:hypothetical protein
MPTIIAHKKAILPHMKILLDNIVGLAPHMGYVELNRSISTPITISLTLPFMLHPRAMMDNIDTLEPYMDQVIVYMPQLLVLFKMSSPQVSTFSHQFFVLWDCLSHTWDQC